MRRPFRYKKGDILERWYLEGDGTYYSAYYVVVCCLRKQAINIREEIYYRKEYRLFDVETRDTLDVIAKSVHNPEFVYARSKTYGTTLSGWRKVNKENTNV